MQSSELLDNHVQDVRHAGVGACVPHRGLEEDAFSDCESRNGLFAGLLTGTEFALADQFILADALDSE